MFGTEIKWIEGFFENIAFVAKINENGTTTDTPSEGKVLMINRLKKNLSHCIFSVILETKRHALGY
jgi:hypothetical protein